MDTYDDEFRTFFNNFVDVYLKRIARDNNWTNKHFKDTQAKLTNFGHYNNLGQKKISEITVQEIEDFLSWLSEHGNIRMNCGLSNGTVNRYCAALCIIFKKALVLQYINTYLNFGWKKEGDGRPNFFSDDEISQLYNFFKTDRTYSKYTWLQDFLTIGLFTGMRLGEIRQLGSTAKVLKDEDGEYIYLPRGMTKNGDEREIPIDGQPELKAAIDRIGNASIYFNHHVFHKAWRKARLLTYSSW